jgi:hypothetical protein
MILNTLLREHNWELVLWNDILNNVCIAVGPNADIINYIKEYTHSCTDEDNILTEYLNKYQDVPFVIADDIESALECLDEKLSECEIIKCSSRNRAAERLCEIAHIFGYIDCV